MAHESRLEGLTAAEAAEVEEEFRQLGATNIRRTSEGGGTFTVTATFPGSPFATVDANEVEAPTPVSRAEPPLTISADTAFSEIANEYRLCFDTCKPDADRLQTIEAQVQKLRLGETRYRGLGQRLGIPWHFIGIIHSLECGCNFKLHLHNGDSLAERTIRVPLGRPFAGVPPFTWEESAEDALSMKGYIGLDDWSVASMLFRWESYNGMGYRKLGVPTPYLWSFSNIYEKGLFVVDHEFDKDAVSKQCGAAILLKALQETL
jgi:lysozyme family protein